MRRTMLALLLAGLARTVLAAEPAPVTASTPAASASAAAGREDAWPDVPGEDCGRGPRPATSLEVLPGLGSAQASPAVKCSQTVCSSSLRCCVPYACVAGRCLID